MWHLYVIEKGGRYYVGITTDIAHRLRQHGVHDPIFRETYGCKKDAAARERQIKVSAVAQNQPRRNDSKPATLKGEFAL